MQSETFADVEPQQRGVPQRTGESDVGGSDRLGQP